jgi:phosphopantothenoylcysteine synthetase/decarboxylase
MKKIMVTAGGTREYIDDVRVLTNISSGKLGKMIVDQFLMSGKQYNIHYVCPKGAFIPDQDELDSKLQRLSK